MTSTHRYDVTCSWTGSTGVGYESYDRTHDAAAGTPPITVALSSDPAFRGDPSLLNPEQLLVLAAASCQLLSFLAAAARARIDVVAYQDEARGFMPEDDRPVRITRIELAPRIAVASAVSEDRIRHLVEVAHRQCYIANSLRTDVVVTPTIVTSSPATD
jgi:organic hydroperoxide reductase OsmC/OhrA